jgi:isoquinoline 1-oxidoreductase beta subunit
VHTTFLGGGFGRKSKADFAGEAAYIARAAGVPVRVQWTREDDLRHDYYNTVSTQRLTAGVDARGKVVAWRHRTAFPPISSLFTGAAQAAAADLQQGVLDLPLAVPNVRAEACAAKAHVRVGWLRSVYNIFHAFAISSFMDELAHELGRDPREMMLELLGPPRQASLAELGIPSLPNYHASLEDHPVDVGRLRHVIERVTESSGWSRRHARKRSLGLAAHRSFLSYSAAVVSAYRDPQGRIGIDEAWLVIDAGQLVHPDRVRAQMEGSVVFGTSIALHGGVTMKDGATEQGNFDTMRIARMRQAARRIHVELVRSHELPGGVGEPGVPPVAPAIANAVFALTGRRVRSLPLDRAGVPLVL